MAEPSTSSILVGAGAASLATYLLGPVLGNYAAILGMGLMGTLVALTDEDFHVDGQPVKWSDGAWKALKFIFRGTMLSFAFTGIIAYVVSSYLPEETGLTPYAILTPIAFSIGWTSNKWSLIKDRMVSFVGGIIDRFSSGQK